MPSFASPSHHHRFPTLQAPQEIVSLFSGSRQVVYGFVPHCKQATLRAKIGSKHVDTMVSTSELGMTKGRVRARTYSYPLDYYSLVLFPDPSACGIADFGITYGHRSISAKDDRP